MGPRASEMSETPTPRLKIDLLLLDIEMRIEQVRQLKPYEPWRCAAVLASASTVAGSAVAGAILWTAHC